MAKVASSLTVAFTLTAGLLFQSGRKESSNTKEPQVSVKRAAGQRAVGEGPWVASCRYWAAVHHPESTGTQSQSNTTPKAIPADASGCGSEAEDWGWNIPSANHTTGVTDLPVTDITAMIAVVPDPVHSGLALDFDRTLASILLAGADNHYLSDYYWLPWQQRGTAKTSDSSATPSASNSQRERQPGLIILRYAPETNEWPRKSGRTGESQADGTIRPIKGTRDEYSWRSYRKVIYLFLVAETPALGINGEQLQNALRYEAYLHTYHDAHLSIQRTGKRVTQPHGRVLSYSTPQSGAPEPANSGQGKSLLKERVVAHPIAEESEVLSVIGPSYSGTAASLYAGITAGLPQLGNPAVSITGVTSTTIALHELDPTEKGAYRSFGENTGFEQDRFLEALIRSGYDLSRVAVLSEAGTVFGSTTGEDASGGPASHDACVPGRRGCYRKGDKPLDSAGTILNLRFPRELSVLRNATANEIKEDTNAAPTPYLGFSLKGDAADDTVERFSTTQTPLSIEAQLMAIANQLRRARTQFILISASNILDDVFLAEFLHRACPDARLVMSNGGDLLFEREGENASYVGSLSISPYLLSSLDFTQRSQWLHSDYHSEEMYNAASFAFHKPDPHSEPGFSGYLQRLTSEKDGRTLVRQISLWASVIGSDGYYPLALLNWCGSDEPALLPSISLDLKPRAVPALSLCSEDDVLPKTDKATSHIKNVRVPESINSNSGIVPALPWQILVGLLCSTCLAHSICLMVADLWSPFTRDLAIDQNDSPHRRAVYLNIGASVLAAMAFVTAYPLLRVNHYFYVTPGSRAAAIGLLCCAALVCLSTVWKTWRYFYHPNCRTYTFFNSVAALAFLGIVTLWSAICGSDTLHGYPSFAGLYHSFRCLQPFSGVSPICPVVLVLLAWYLWAIYQTARLRFSHVHRPRIPRFVVKSSLGHELYPMFVADNTLEACDRSRSSCLYANITSLLITREIVARILKNASSRWLDSVLGFIYVVLFCACLILFRIHSVDRFVFTPVLFTWGPTLYEALLKVLFFPLLMVAFSGWLRVLFIWAALNRGLLEPLERMPIRFAFDRYKSGGWMSMLRQKGLHIRWRDMSRSTESIRQIVHHPDLKNDPALFSELSTQHEAINHQILGLMESIRNDTRAATEAMPAQTPAEAAIKPCPSELLWDMPRDCADVCSIFRIESGYAEFCTILIDRYLAERWEQRPGVVDHPVTKTNQEVLATDAPVENPPALEQLAEELIVIRYVALIRAVLLNIRYQMLIVGTTFVLTLAAWNSFPFQPHAFMDWGFTFLLAALSAGFIAVFAQMHRSAILSRITDTTPNELGWEFYLRILTFGAVPVLTWIAYEFPQIGGTIYKLLQPSLQVVK